MLKISPDTVQLRKLTSVFSKNNKLWKNSLPGASLYWFRSCIEAWPLGLGPGLSYFAGMPVPGFDFNDPDLAFLTCLLGLNLDLLSFSCLDTVGLYLLLVRLMPFFALLSQT